MVVYLSLKKIQDLDASISDTENEIKSLKNKSEKKMWLEEIEEFQILYLKAK